MSKIEGILRQPVADRKKPRAPAYREGFGILNPYGDMWSPDVFDTKEDAVRHLLDFWEADEARVAGFRIVEVRQRTSFVRALPEATLSRPRLDGEEE